VAVRSSMASLDNETKRNPGTKLGSLERDVLEFMWESRESTVALASKAIVAKRPRSLASVGVVLKRLAAKGFLTRIKDEAGLRYCLTC
jgi:predicted transcriptional regulator